MFSKVMEFIGSNNIIKDEDEEDEDDDVDKVESNL